MRTLDLHGGPKIEPLKYTLGDSPHATVETNRTCNLGCRFCYNIDHEWVKTLQEIRGEIDLLLKKRNLQVITLLGGEPTLHPSLAEIVACIKAKKIKCQLLTNGLVFLNAAGDALLKKLKRSGIDRILLHIDAGQQHVHGDVEIARHFLFAKMEKNKIPFSLSLTLDEKESGRIPHLIMQYADYRYFDGILAVLAKDPLNPRDHHRDLRTEYESIRSRLRLEPTAYIPSNLADTEIQWLLYFFFIDQRTGRTFGLTPWVHKAIRQTYRLVRGCQLFMVRCSPFLCGLAFRLVSMANGLARCQEESSIPGPIKPSAQTRSRRFLSIAIQKPPEWDDARKELHLCYHCPDATIRNGKLTPVCIADLINPRGQGSAVHAPRPDRRRAAYAHLGESPD